MESASARMALPAVARWMGRQVASIVSFVGIVAATLLSTAVLCLMSGVLGLWGVCRTRKTHTGEEAAGSFPNSGAASKGRA